MKKFKAESQRLLELMINSIYTNKEIFLRELISNASDALDKLHFISLTDSAASRDFAIRLCYDKDKRVLIIEDNGVGMSEKDLENNLGVIAESGTFKFKSEQKQELIGQFGVGFYSAFMVADEVTVLSKKYGENEAHIWKSRGVEGYEILPGQRTESGTTVSLHLKDKSEDFSPEDYLDDFAIKTLVKKYSDYISYPIIMETTQSRKKENSDEWEDFRADEVLNSRTPIWRKRKDETSEADFQDFYRRTYYDFTPPLDYLNYSVEGSLTYSALLFIPDKMPYGYFTSDYKRGLALYSSGVMIMECCDKLLPEYLGFIKGLVDSADLNLNISREMLQNDRQLAALRVSVEKKLLSFFRKMMEENREKYDQLFEKYGASLKYGLYADYGAKKEELKDLVEFYSSSRKKIITLKEYVEGMKEGQNEIFYASGKTISAIDDLPQLDKFKDDGVEVLYFTDHIDEFVIKILADYDGKKFKSVGESESEAAPADETEILTFITESLDGKVKETRLSKKLKNYPSCLTAEGEISLEMERILNSMKDGGGVKATRILELNPSHSLYQRAKELFESDKDGLKELSKVLYGEAALMEGGEMESPAEFVAAINKLLAKND